MRSSPGQSWHLLPSLPRAQDAMLEMVESGLLKVEFALTGEIGQCCGWASGVASNPER